MTKRSLIIAIPMLWLAIFFLAPFFVVFKISLADLARARPPYTPLLSWEEGRLAIQASLDNYKFLLSDNLYIVAYLSSIKIAAISTLVALFIGYPMALVIARTSEPWRSVLLMLVVLPFWTSFLLRVYAWIGILKGNGIINNLLIYLGIIDDPLIMLQTDFAVYLGIVYTYLPFMILPLYASAFSPGHTRRLSLGLYPRHWRIRHPGAFGRTRHIDDRQSSVDRVFQQPRLARRRRSRHRHAGFRGAACDVAAQFAN